MKAFLLQTSTTHSFYLLVHSFVQLTFILITYVLGMQQCGRQTRSLELNDGAGQMVPTHWNVGSTGHHVNTEETTLSFEEPKKTSLKK